MERAHDSEIVASTVQQVLLQRLRAAGSRDLQLTQGTKLLELGLIDSEELVEVILEVEERCACEFDPGEIDLEVGLTLSSFIGSFVLREH